MLFKDFPQQGVLVLLAFGPRRPLVRMADGDKMLSMEAVTRSRQSDSASSSFHCW